MRRNRYRSAREAAERRAWLREAENWNGEAVVFNPFDRTYEPATQYQANIVRPMMNWFDRLPPGERRRIANSANGE
jgi:hypothetical protein